MENIDINRLKSRISFGIPAELYRIEPGQIIHFVSQEGISGKAIERLRCFRAYVNKLHPGCQIGFHVVETEVKELIDTFAGRVHQENGTPYKVVVGSIEQNLAGFIAEYFGDDIEDVAKNITSKTIIHISNSTMDKPVVVTLDPNDCPVKEHHKEQAQFTCPFMDDAGSDFGMGLKIAKPEKDSLDEKKLIAKEYKKLEKLLRECAIMDIELDIDSVKQKVADSLRSDCEYKLILDIKTIKEGTLSFCPTCDIYVAKGKNYRLNLTAAEKAAYLTFLLYENGIRLLDAFDEFRRITQKIYNQLPSEDKCEKNAGGILDTGAVNPEVYANTLRTYISTIRDEVADKISNPMVAQDFAIEGFKYKEFGIAVSTPDLRAQIKQAFQL